MSFARLLSPRGIAVFGGREAEEVVRQCRKAGFDGEIWPVHPKKDEVAGLRVYRSVAELPRAPDAAYIALNRHLTIEIVHELAQRGAGGAICYASGFAEAGEEGRRLQHALERAAGEMPVLGPNCYGLLNYLDRATLWPDQHGGETVERGVAIVTQSSNVAVNFSMQQRGLPIAYLVSLGNRLRFDLHDAIREFAQQERVSAIGLYLESIGDPTAFDAAVRLARSLGKPVVAIKAGRSGAAQQMAMSHTASLSGTDELIDALFARAGVGRVSSMEALLEALKVLHVQGPLDGYRLGSMSPSGGDAALLADALEGRRLYLPALPDGHHEAVRATLHERVTASNPFDYQLFDWADQARLTETFAAFVRETFDLSVCVFDYPRGDRCDAASWMPAQNALVEAVARTGARTAVLSMLPEDLPEATAKYLIDQGIVPLAGLAAGLEGLQAAADIGLAWRRPGQAPLRRAAAFDADAPAMLLDEAESKARLAAFGLRVPDGEVVGDAAGARAAAERLGYPLVVKALGVAHKTDVGGVALNLDSADAVAGALAGMAHLADRFLIERMVGGVVAELIVGVLRDPQFGPYLVVGAGGVLVELLRDSRPLLLPTSREEVLAALRELRSAPLFEGFRGRARADLEAAADAVLAVAHFAQEQGDAIAELDINPLLLLAEGQGAVAADALLRLQAPAANNKKPGQDACPSLEI